MQISITRLAAILPLFWFEEEKNHTMDACIEVMPILSDKWVAVHLVNAIKLESEK